MYIIKISNNNSDFYIKRSRPNRGSLRYFMTDDIKSATLYRRKCDATHTINRIDIDETSKMHGGEWKVSITKVNVRARIAANATSSDCYAVTMKSVSKTGPIFLTRYKTDVKTVYLTTTQSGDATFFKSPSYAKNSKAWHTNTVVIPVELEIS